MAHQPLHAVLQHIRKVAAGPRTCREDDRELLERFVDHQDRAAFAALVQRHGPMVRGVCWRLLRHESDTDDAFQATFLVLLSKARSIRKGRSLGSWLYGVAFRTAQRARTAAARRQAHEQQAAVTSCAEPSREAAWREFCTVLDEEVQGLSEKYRAPLVLCYLQGRTRDETAHQLGWSLRTLQRRLERAREILRMRLTRRGLTLSAGLLATALSEHAAGAALPAGLVNVTVKAAFAYAAGKAAAAGLISGQAAALARGVLTAMFISKLTTLGTIVLAVAVIGSGAGLWTYHTLAAEQTDNKDKKAAQKPVEREPGAKTDKKAAGPALESGEEKQPLVRVPSQRDGIVRVIGTEIRGGEEVPAGQTVTVQIGTEMKKYRRLKKGETVEKGQLLARLDDELARADEAIMVAKLTSAKVDKVLSEKTRDEASARYETQKRLYGMGRSKDKAPAGPATSLEDLRGARLTWERYVEETNSREQAIEIAKQELNKSRRILKMYEIRSPSRGVIKAIYKRPGEAVKALETVFLIQVPEE